MNGTIQVNLIPSHSLAAGDSIRIFEAKSFTGNPQFDLPEIGNGLEWDTSRISEGLLFVTRMPSTSMSARMWWYAGATCMCATMLWC